MGTEDVQDHATASITAEELMAEHVRIERQAAAGIGADGERLWTVQELAEAAGVSNNTILRQLRAMQRAGRLIIGKKYITRMGMRGLWPVPAYRLKSGRKPQLPKSRRRS